MRVEIIGDEASAIVVADGQYIGAVVAVGGDEWDARGKGDIYIETGDSIESAVCYLVGATFGHSDEPFELVR